MSARGGTEEAGGASQGAARAAADARPRRARLLHVLAACVALVGLADSIYLTVEHLAGRSGNVPCVVTAGCDKVLQSAYATLPGGVPLAALGVLAYFTVFSLATLAVFDYEIAGRLLAPVVALMFVATLVLLYVQAFVLEAFCTYCLLSACLTLMLTFIVLARRFGAESARPS